ncbi:MFS transporter [Paramicrobacterium agarici]|uniref:DHA3 family multidrug efflux protein-like MFS transporter n=1 Tax=Paramicrobacterium agarici TaxID=630514 RepID=A0A2A9DV64_9MICO|nr:DHA3 family multidrug efflux protein-like MFS transporter [Microbacterium agarici]
MDESSESAGPEPGTESHSMSTFLQVLVNTGVANITTSFLWFALTFWVYLETKSVLATGIIGGAYMLMVAVCSMMFGTLVDRFRKHAVMVASGAGTLVCFGIAGVMFLLLPESELLRLSGPWFWLFTVVILAGAVVEQLRNIALSTTVTLLVPGDRRANANGLVGTVQGLAFLVTSVFSGLAIGLVGMGGTIIIAITIIAVVLGHLLTVRIAEPEIVHEGHTSLVDIKGGFAAVRAASPLMALIVFTTFNNLVGGVYMALMDPYGLELFPVEIWGLVLGVTSTGFLIGGAVIAKFGLGKNPIRTMLIMVIATGVLGSLFTLREWWWLYAAGIWVFMMLMPAVEAAEQTIIQRIVPYRTQGRVFGFAMTFEAAAAPVTAFLVAPLAEFWVIPYVESDAGAATWGWLLGEGTARGMALVMVFAGLGCVLLGAGAFLTRSYRKLSARYAEIAAQDAAEGEETSVELGSDGTSARRE